MKIIKLTLIAVACAASTMTFASTGCLKKEQAITKQIEYAKAHGNSHRVAGLEKALSEVKAHCTDAGLKTDLQHKVKEKEQKVAERKQELKEAQSTGKQKKIAKKQKKLLEAEQELTEARQDLKNAF